MVNHARNLTLGNLALALATPNQSALSPPCDSSASRNPTSEKEKENLLGAVVHVVVNRIQARLIRARIALKVARKRLRVVIKRQLIRRVVNEITIAVAAVALKRVQQAEPVARLVGEDLALVVEQVVAVVEGVGPHDDAVLDKVAVALGDVLGQHGVAAGPVLHDVDVEGAVAAAAQRVLHVVVVLQRVVGLPLGVDGVVEVLEGEAKGRGLVPVVEDMHDLDNLAPLRWG